MTTLTERAKRGSHARDCSGRRRHIDPTTSEKDYDSDEMEFMMAMQQYKKNSGRPFPTWSEALEVVKSLGYRKTVEPTPILMSIPTPIPEFTVLKRQCPAFVRYEDHLVVIRWLSESQTTKQRKIPWGTVDLILSGIVGGSDKPIKIQDYSAACQLIGKDAPREMIYDTMGWLEKIGIICKDRSRGVVLDPYTLKDCVMTHWEGLEGVDVISQLGP